MDPLSGNPFTVFTLIAAPAVLTNASAVMSLTTSNRLARAIDRSRELQGDLTHVRPAEERAANLRRLEVARRRALLLMKALGAFQLAYGSFAAAALVALTAGALAAFHLYPLDHAALFVSFGCFVVAIFATIVGAVRLVRETRLAYEIMRDDTASLLAALNEPPKA